MTITALLRRRAAVWFLGVLCLLGLGIAAELTRPYPTLLEVLADPQRFDNRRLALIVECHVAGVTPSGFILQQMDSKILVRSDEKEVHVGDDLVIEGIFHAPARLDVLRMRIASRRRMKMVISVVPALLVIVLVITNVSYDRHAGEFFLRKSPHA